MSQPKFSELINQLMFDYTDCTGEELAVLSQPLPNKILRWLATHHPDNRTRKIFLRQTGVAIGNGSVVNANFVVSDDYQPLLHLGDRVAVSPNVTVICASAPNDSILAQYPYVREHLVKSAPVVIEDDAWIGCNVVILPGVTIGRGAIVGACAVVSCDVAPFTVVAGVPAKFIRHLDT